MKRCLPNPTGNFRGRPARAALLLAVLLALTAGCAPAPDALVQPPAAAESAVTAESAATPESAAPEGAGPARTLALALEGCLTYEGGTAGSSLKTARAAAALVVYLAQEAPGADAAHREAAQWREDLGDGDRATLGDNWPGVYACARSICEDPAAQQGLLADAGVTADFGAMDLTAVPEQLDAVDRALTG